MLVFHTHTCLLIACLHAHCMLAYPSLAYLHCVLAYPSLAYLHCVLAYPSLAYLHLHTLTLAYFALGCFRSSPYTVVEVSVCKCKCRSVSVCSANVVEVSVSKCQCSRDCPEEPFAMLSGIYICILILPTQESEKYVTSRNHHKGFGLGFFKEAPLGHQKQHNQ